MGYGIIAVPTGIVSSEMTRTEKNNIPTNTKACTSCTEEYHRDDAEFCHKCGHQLDNE
jgi:voltage-gated potassium channel